MPNHVTTYLSIEATPELIKELLEKTKLKQETNINDNEFDFNGITPMPEEVRDTTSPLHITDTQEEADKINAQHVEELKNWPEELRGSLSKVKALSREEYNRRIAKYGADGWYEWSCKHWGTKWNSYEVNFIASSPTNLVLEFQTAWSIPKAIFDTLEEQGYELHYYWQDEDPSNYGEYGSPEDYFVTWTERTVEYIGAN